MDSTATDLFNLLVSRDYTVKTLTSQGKPETNPGEAEMFSFDFETSRNNYGTVVILLDDEGNFEVYYGDNIGKNIEGDDKDAWYDFLNQLKTFATRNLLTFTLKNINKLKYSMQGMAAINEGLFEGWNGTKHISYNNKPGTTRLKIVHSKAIEEGEQRWRAIDKLYVENSDGERFKLPFTSLVAGRAMARHVAEGGTPYDVFGQHITDMVREANILNKFVRATNTITEDDAEQFNIVEAGRERYNTVRQRIKSLAGKRGYHSYKESWSPADLDEDEALVNALRGSFMRESIDQRIDEALPWILRALASKPARKVYKNIAKYALPTAIGVGLANKYPLDKDVQNKENEPKVVQQQPEKKDTKESTMKEFDQFANWAENVTEGTWAIPDDDAKIKKLKEILAEPLPVGVDAMNATNVLYDIIGDDELFDSLAALAEDDPEADARPVIEHWLEMYTDSHPSLEDLADRVLGGEEELEFDEAKDFGARGMNKYGMSAIKTAQGFFALINGKVVAGPFDTLEDLKAYQEEELNNDVNEQLDIDTGKEQKKQERDPMLEAEMMNKFRKLAGMPEKVYENFDAFTKPEPQQVEETVDTPLRDRKDFLVKSKELYNMLVNPDLQDVESQREIQSRILRLEKEARDLGLLEMTEQERASKLNNNILDELNASDLGKEGVDWFAPSDTEPYDPERDDPRDAPNYGFDRKPTKPQSTIAPGAKKTQEGNAFSGALAAAKKAGKSEFEVDGKTYKVDEAAVGSAEWKRGIDQRLASGQAKQSTPAQSQSAADAAFAKLGGPPSLGGNSGGADSAFDELDNFKFDETAVGSFGQQDDELGQGKNTDPAQIVPGYSGSNDEKLEEAPGDEQLPPGYSRVGPRGVLVGPSGHLSNWRDPNMDPDYWARDYMTKYDTDADNEWDEIENWLASGSYKAGNDLRRSMMLKKYGLDQGVTPEKLAAARAKADAIKKAAQDKEDKFYRDMEVARILAHDSGSTADRERSRIETEKEIANLRKNAGLATSVKTTPLSTSTNKDGSKGSVDVGQGWSDQMDIDDLDRVSAKYGTSPASDQTAALAHQEREFAPGSDEAWDQYVAKHGSKSKVPTTRKMGMDVMDLGLKGESKEAQLDEKWGTETKVSPSEKGKYEGKSATELRKAYNKLKASGPHEKGSKEYGKMRELAFAIRAKTGWGKVSEAGKPDYLDLDKDGNKEEPMKKAAQDAEKKDDKELGERSLTKGEEKKREKYVKGMKKSKADFKKRYGKRGEEVMYATATKMAKESEGATDVYGKGIYESLTELETDLDLDLGNGITATSQLDKPKVGLLEPEEIGSTDITVVAPIEEPKEKNLGDKIADKGAELSAQIDAALADIKRLALGN